MDRRETLRTSAVLEGKERVMKLNALNRKSVGGLATAALLSLTGMLSSDALHAAPDHETKKRFLPEGRRVVTSCSPRTACDEPRVERRRRGRTPRVADCNLKPLRAERRHVQRRACRCVERVIPGYYKTVVERVKTPGYYKKVWVPARDFRFGRHVSVSLCDGYYKKVWVPGKVRCIEKQVWVPAKRVIERKCRHHRR